MSLIAYDLDKQCPVGYISVKDAALKYGVAETAIRAKVMRNRIRHIKVCKMIFIPEDEIWMDYRKWYSGRKPEDFTRFGWDRAIKRNAIRCKRCGDIIESRHVHDFKWCSCGQCAVDGGKDYPKRCWSLEIDDADDAFEELIEYE